MSRYSDSFIALCSDLKHHVLAGNFEAAVSVTQSMGMIHDSGKIDLPAYRDLLRTLYEPILKDQEYRFTAGYVRRTWEVLALKNPNRFQMSLSKELIFTNRIQWGLYAVLALLGARSNWHQRFKNILEFKKLQKRS